MNNLQKTLNSSATFKGIGLHSGKKVEINIYPEKEEAGIYFYINNKKILADWSNVKLSPLCTTISANKNFVSTIEHLMSALSALDITNAKIVTNSNEMPILDGSSKEYYEVLKKIGTKIQPKKKLAIKISKEVLFKINEKFISIAPSKINELKINLTIDYKDQFIKKQNLTYIHNNQNYTTIYKARTFCLHDDLEKIFAMGLAKGGSLDNAIVVSGNKILNQGGLRYPDEFVRHKILDCVGDLYLAGKPIYGNVTSYQGGHELNVSLLKEIFKNKKNYKIVEC